MKKQKSSLTKQPPQLQPLVSAAVPRSFGRTFVIKNVLPYETELTEDDKPEKKAWQPDEFRKLVKANRAVLFREETLGMSAEIGNSPFDAFTFLFDFSGEKPRCFILSMILSGSPFDFFFMKLTRIFGFLRSMENRMKIFSLRTRVRASCYDHIVETVDIKPSSLKTR